MPPETTVEVTTEQPAEETAPAEKAAIESAADAVAAAAEAVETAAETIEDETGVDEEWLETRFASAENRMAEIQTMLTQGSERMLAILASLEAMAAILAELRASTPKAPSQEPELNPATEATSPSGAADGPRASPEEPAPDQRVRRARLL